MNGVSTPSYRRAGLSLVWQLVLLAVVPAVLAVGALLVLTTRQYLQGIEHHIRQQGETLAQQLSASAQAPLAREDRRALLRLAEATMSQPHVQQVQVWSPEGELLANVNTADLRRKQGLLVRAPVASAGGGVPGQVGIDIGLDELRAAEARAWTGVLLAVAACLAAVLLAGVWAARRISAPVLKLANAVDRLAAGEPVQVTLEGTAEVRHLQQGFNAAATALHDGRQLLEQRVREATAELAEKNRAIEQASQAKTRLLAAASHDLRQPLHALTLFSEGLARDEPDPARQQRIRHVRECVASLDHLFAELLNISQIDAGVLQPRHSDFALDRLFDDVSRNFRPVAEAQHLRLVVRHTDLWVRSDYFMLSRIVGNLVANAVRYTPHGGVLVAARRRGPRVRIDVIDTGIGIAPEHQQRIFDEFYQVRSGAETAGRGTGLGLATVQRLAGLLGLQIGLTSAPGRGARFHFEVPMAAPEPAGAPAADEAAVLPMPCDGRAPPAHDGRVVPAAPLPAPVPPGQEAPLAVA